VTDQVFKGTPDRVSSPSSLYTNYTIKFYTVNYQIKNPPSFLDWWVIFKQQTTTPIMYLVVLDYSMVVKLYLTYNNIYHGDSQMSNKKINPLDFSNGFLYSYLLNN